MDVEKFINEIHVRLPLWDQKDRNHHNRFVLDKLWGEVALKLNIPRITARNKWKSLRDIFRVTLASIPKPKSDDPASSYKGQWKYFQSLLFLKDQFPRLSREIFPINEDDVLDNTLQNSQEDKDVSSCIIHHTSCVDENENQPLMPLDKAISPEQCTEPVTLSSSRPSNFAESHRNISTKRKRSASEDIADSALLEVETKKLQHLEEKSKNRKANDDDDLNFFKSLLPHVKTLSSYNKMSYRMQILKVTQDFLTLSNETEKSSNPVTINSNNNTIN